MECTVEQAIQKYLEIREHKTALVKKQKEEVAKLDKHLEAFEGFLNAEMERTGVKSMRTTYGTAFQKRPMQVKTTDKDALFTFVKENDRFDLLTAAISKDAVKEWLGLNDIDTDKMSLQELNELVARKSPPGMEIAHIIDIQVRKAS